MLETRLSVRPFITEIVLESELATYTLLLIGLTATLLGKLPTLIPFEIEFRSDWAYAEYALPKNLYWAVCVDI